MFFKRWMRSRNTLVQIIFGFAAALVLTAGIGTTLVCGYVRDRIADGEAAGSRKMAAQWQAQLGSLDQAMKRLCVMLYADNDVRALMYLTGEEDYERLGVLNALNATYLKSHPEIQSIWIYNPLKAQYYSTSGRLNDRDREWDKLMSSDDELPVLQPIIRVWNPVDGGGSDATAARVLTYLMKDSTGGRNAGGAVILNVRLDALPGFRDDADEEAGGRQDRVFVYDARSRFVPLSASADEAGEQVGRAVQARYEAAASSSSAETSAHVGTFTVRANGETYRVAAADPGTGWVLLYAAYAEPEPPALHAVRTGAIVGTAALLAALSFAYRLLARKVLQPPGPLMDRLPPEGQQKAKGAGPEPADAAGFLRVLEEAGEDIRALMRERLSSRSVMKRYFLRRLLESGSAVTEDELARARRQYDLRLTPQAPILVCLLRIDDYASQARRMQPDELNAMRFVVGQAATEIVSREFAVEAVDLGDDRTALIVAFSRNKEEADADAERLGARIREAQQHLMRRFKVSVTVACSSLVQDVGQAPTACHEAEQISHYRFVQGKRAFLVPADVSRRVVPLSVDAVFQIERKFIGLLIRGDLRPAGEQLDVLLRLVSEMAYHDMRYLLLHLVNSLKHALYEADTIPLRAPQIDELFDSRRLFEQETMEEFRQRLIEAVNETFEAAVLPSDEETALAESIRRYILDRHADPNLGVAQIAAAFDRTVPFANLLFESSYGMAIPAYIHHVRIDKAVELMENTKLELEEIVRLTGWTNVGHFHRQFEARYGFGPRDYVSQLAGKRLTP
ncbi:AraC family transcriptional regulator [Cohnella sp. REN36]|uniref:helix-turn-helix domain-containing protein n=1 Tax=Cohnella sp. REN36 TaxID=2887347 RepID=UPI001D1386FD|nr:helix-turn-helix domain-containing protein [Cohnella sp. REN36]MCC3377050.1 helix-turn-helix domain-containing protein [Cohnella sp. REN36]